MNSKNKLHINIPSELYNWLKVKSKDNYSTITKYVIDLIIKDMRRGNE